MTRAEHMKRHQELLKALDQLVAAFLRHHDSTQGYPKLLSNTTLLELMEWSSKQAIDPDETPT